MPQIVWTYEFERSGANSLDNFYNQKGVDCLFSLRVTEQIRFVNQFSLTHRGKLGLEIPQYKDLSPKEYKERYMKISHSVCESLLKKYVISYCSIFITGVNSPVIH